MADWLSKPWIEKAINSFYDKHASPPRFARAQIIQFNKIPSGKSPSAEALLSDKWMYAKAILTPQAIEEFEKSPSNICEFSLCDIKGGLIFLNEYRVVPHVDYAKGVWEHLLIVNKFTFQGSEKSSQFGSELINSGAHSPFQVRIKKHFQLKQLVQLLQSDKNKRALTLDENKAFDIKSIMDSFTERHQFAFIPEDQQKLLDEIPEWRNDFCPPSTSDPSNSLNTSLPSNQEAQYDVCMSPSSNDVREDNGNQQLSASCQGSSSNLNRNSNDSHFSLKELSPNHGQFGLFNSYDDNGTYVKIAGDYSLPSVQKSPANSISGDTAGGSADTPGASKIFTQRKDGLGKEKLTKRTEEKKDKKIGEKNMDVDDENNSLPAGYLSSERNKPTSTKPMQSEENTQASELTPKTYQKSPYVALLDILENLEHESDSLGSKRGKQHTVGKVVEEEEDINDWTEAADKDKRIRRSSVELALVKQSKKRDEWLSRCSNAQLSFNESSLSGKNADGEEIKNTEEKHLDTASDVQQGDNSPRRLERNSQIFKEIECSRFWVEFSQSQDLERKGMTEVSTNEFMKDLVEGDIVEIVIRDAFDCARKGTAKNVVSISKEACHSGSLGKEFEGESTRDCENIQQKNELDRKSSENEETQERYQKLTETEGFASSSREIYKNASSSPRMIDNDAECINKCIKGIGISNDKRWLRSEDSYWDPKSDVIEGMDNSSCVTDSQRAVEREANRIDALDGSDQEEEQDQGEPRSMSRDQAVGHNVEETDIQSQSYEAPCSVFEAVHGRRILEKEDQDLDKEAREYTCTCCLGEAVSDVSTCRVCKDRCLSNREGLVQNSTSDGSSSLGQRSDESFSILKNVSDFDLTLGGFKPEFTSTAQPNVQVTSVPGGLTGVDMEDEVPGVVHVANITVKDKHVTFGGDSFYVDKLDIPGHPVGRSPVPSKQLIAFPSYSNALDDSFVPCTQQEDDHEPLKDPLQILQSVSSSTTEVIPKNPNSIASGNLASEMSGAGRHGNDGLQCLNDDNDDAPRRPADDDDDSQGSFVIKVDREIILCSVESEEITCSPITLAKDSVINCIKSGDTSKKINKDLIMGSDDSPRNTSSSSPKTIAKDSILRCIQQEVNSKADVIRLRSQSKQSSMPDIFSARNAKMTKEIADTSRSVSLQFSLSDSELVKAFNTPSRVSAKENSSLPSKNGKNLKERKTSSQAQLNTLTTPRKAREPDSIPCTSFNRTQYNLNSEKQMDFSFQMDFSSPEEEFEKRTSFPADTHKEVECLLYVPSKGLETSAVCVTMASKETSNKPDKSTLDKEFVNHKDRTGKGKAKELLELSKKARNSEFIDTGNGGIFDALDNRNAETKRLQGVTSTTSVAMETQETITAPPNVSHSNHIPNQLGFKGSRYVDKPVALKSCVLPRVIAGKTVSRLSREGGFKRKRSQEGDKTSVLKKMTFSSPSATLMQGSTKCLNIDKDKSQHEKAVKDKPFGTTSSQAFMEFSCDHVMYSQQDPLILDFSFSSDNADVTSSQESNNQDMLSSPILLPSPPRQIKTEEVSDIVDSCSQSIQSLKRGQRMNCVDHVMYSQQEPLVIGALSNVDDISQSSNAEIPTSIFKQCDKTIEEASSISEEHDLSSPQFDSLPSYQIPTTSNNKCLPMSVIPEKTKNPTSLIDEYTLKGKTKPFIVSDSEEDDTEEDDTEDSFCWFTTDSWKR